MRARGRSEPEELASLEMAVTRGGGEAGVVKNLYNLYTQTGASKKADAVIAIYQDTLRRSGFSGEEIEQELELLW